VQSAAPDGYTLLFAAHPPFVIQPMLMKAAAYDAGRGYTPIAKVASIYMAMVVGKSAPFSTFDQFVDHARKNPGEVSYAIPGYGTLSFLDMERINLSLGLKTLGVPYKSATQALTDTIGGQVNMFIPSYPAALPFVASGVLKVLAIGSPQRLESLPNVPTMAEAVKQPGFVSSVWYALLGPAGMKTDVTGRLYREVAAALATPQLKQLLEKANVYPTPGTPEDLSREIAASDEAGRKLITLLGIKPE
jgi:tripartite-type tricarboxylate transporter receptor subunit TctC